MSQDWGLGASSAFIKTKHSNPSAATDPSKVTLPKDFTVCVVGASRGIGAGICTSYTRAGASAIVLASRRVSGLEETAKACRDINPNIKVEIVACDITSPGDVSALAEKVKESFGRLDVLAVNSGYSGHVKLTVTDTDPATLRQAMDVNYTGTFLCAKYFVPILLASPNGAKSLIAVSSMATLIVRGPIANAQYCVSKLAQLKLMEHVHEQYLDQGLGVYSVHPGAVMSEMAEETAPEEFMAYLTDSPELCGSFCVWLTKDPEASKWLSGRLTNSKWDVDELMSLKKDVIEKDLLKIKMTV